MLETVIMLAIIGVCLYLIRQIPMEPIIHTLITVVVVLFAIMWLASVFGLTDIAIPRLHRR